MSNGVSSEQNNFMIKDTTTGKVYMAKTCKKTKGTLNFKTSKARQWCQNTEVPEQALKKGGVKQKYSHHIS
jgi:hypothetical protein